MEEIVKISCVRHTYPDDTQVYLCGLDFVVHRGERVVILGPNGSGKTTLLFHILGLLSPDEGEVKVFGHDPAKEYDRIRKRIGVVLQNVDEQILAPTVFDDVVFSLRNYHFSRQDMATMAERALAKLDISHLKSKVPHYLSGGEKKKVALAGALVTDPELLVLDEPFEGLDPSSRKKVIQLLQELNATSDVATVITTHDANLVPLLADTVYVIAQDGKIILKGEPRKIFAAAELLKEAQIDVPILYQLFSELRKRALDLGTPLELQEATDALYDAIRSNSL